MQSMSYDKEIIIDTLIQVNEAIDMITDWSRDMTSADEYVSSPDGMKTLAATCMLLEAIGEGVKKIDRRTEGFLLKSVCPNIPWKNIMGMRDHIRFQRYGNRIIALTFINFVRAIFYRAFNRGILGS